MIVYKIFREFFRFINIQKVKTMEINSNRRFNIVVIDDMPENLRILLTILNEQGYKVRPLSDGESALQAIRKIPPDLILLDVMMPGMDGFQVCKELKNDNNLKDIPVIFISAAAEVFDKVMAFKLGGVDFITKPFQVPEVLARVRTHVTLSYLQKQLEYQNLSLKQIVDKQVMEISAGHVAAIKSITKLAEFRDEDTGKHIERTQTFCRILAGHLRTKKSGAEIIDDEYIYNIYNASPLHDIGKVAIRDAILLKPDKLDNEEFDIMKTHAAIGADYLIKAATQLSNNAFLLMGKDIARWHHEKWDGSGYPDGLKGEDIPLSARIMAISDVYDALRSKRPYKEPFTHEESRGIITKGSGVHFDPDIVQSFLELEDQFRNVRDSMNDDV